MAQVETTTVREEIERIVERVVERFRPAKVVLFGSHAYGEPHEGSDLDFLVVVSDRPSRREVPRVAHELRQDLPLQVVFMSPEEFDETKDVVGGLAYPAHHWGRVVYEEDS